MKRLAYSILLCSLFALAGSLRADYQDGLNAYNSGEFKRAMSEWLAVTGTPPGEVNSAIYAEAHYAVAKLYWLGQGVPKDHRIAFDWLGKAAGLGHAGAQAKLGFMYTDGKVVSQDFDQAFEWYAKSAQQGNVDGLYNLGIFYLYGWGIEQDTTMAAQYLASAAALGDDAAEQALQTLLPVVEDESRLALIQAPAEQGLSIEEEAQVEEEDEEEVIEAPQPVPLLTHESWIMQQDPEHYTIQVIALSSRARIESLLGGFESYAPFSIYALDNNGNPLFVLVQGSYENVEEARRVRESFPAAIQKTEQLWIRRFAMVQGLIESRDRDTER